MQARDASGRFVRLRESATAEAVRLTEVGSGTLSEQTTGQRRKVTIISAGWGSSGYYSRELLARDGPAAFPVGTHMYLDHPSRTEEADRPERSVRDLAARIASTPRMESDELVAEADIFPVWEPVVDALAQDIGLSIRAMGESEWGEADGRDGDIITAITEGLSVDFVTKAGAGGKVGQLIESARQTPSLEEARNAGNWLEARIHRDFTLMADSLFGDGHLTREERIALSSAIGDALSAFNASVAEQAPGLYRRDPFADAEATDVQVTEAAGSGRRDKEADMADDTRLSELEESVRQLNDRITEAESQRDAEKTRADRAEDALLETSAQRIVDEALKAEPKEGEDALPKLPDRALTRVREAAKGDKWPLTEDGKLDRDKLIERVRKAAKEEADYLAEHSTAGQVSGVGASTTTNGSPATEADTGKLIESFKRLGMTDDAAKLAAQGR